MRDGWLRRCRNVPIKITQTSLNARMNPPTNRADGPCANISPNYPSGRGRLPHHDSTDDVGIFRLIPTVVEDLIPIPTGTESARGRHNHQSGAGVCPRSVLNPLNATPVRDGAAPRQTPHERHAARGAADPAGKCPRGG